jgi:putative FmdB family regulatory protein
LPLYEYQCPECGTFERMQKFSDPILTACPTCNSPVEKLLSPPAIQFKGSGWYVTDYANRGRAPKEEAKSEAKESSAKETKGDGGSKTDSAKSAKSGGTAAGGSSSAE